MTKLTTHVLDIYSGKPGKGIKVELYYLENNKRDKINSITLNEDGRADKPLLEGEDFFNGKYELVFFIGDYFKNIIKDKNRSKTTTQQIVTEEINRMSCLRSIGCNGFLFLFSILFISIAEFAAVLVVI